MPHWPNRLARKLSLEFATEQDLKCYYCGFRMFRCGDDFNWQAEFRPRPERYTMRKTHPAVKGRHLTFDHSSQNRQAETSRVIMDWPLALAAIRCGPAWTFAQPRR
jgi:hypothetical protein